MIYFFIERRVSKKEHHNRVTALGQAISVHRSQQIIRNKNLDKYHLLRYNLSDSLIIQQKISLKTTDLLV